MLRYILDLVARLGHWSYVVIFAAAALECAAFAGLFVPGESLMLASGFFAHQGLLELDAVFLGRFIGFARALVPFVAGASRMPYRQFLVYNALGAVLWTVGCVLLGYFLRASWQVAERWIGRTSLVAGVVVLLVVAVAWAWRRRARPGIRKKAGD